jgi:hypothetical protein
VCNLETVGVPSTLSLIRSAATFTRMLPTFDLFIIRFKVRKNVVYNKSRKRESKAKLMNESVR